MLYNTDELIDGASSVPKYQQVADLILSTIGTGSVKIGDRIPSINQISEELLLSRDTVEKAYRNLRKSGVITTIKGKGCFVSSISRNNGIRILLVFNKLSDHKKAIFNSFTRKLGDTATVDLQIHHSDCKVLEKIIMDNIGKYDYYVILPHLRSDEERALAAIDRIPKEKLLLINKDMKGITGNYGCVFEDFESDLIEALSCELDRIKKYNKLILVFPEESHYCASIQDGFIRFCSENKFPYKIIPAASSHQVRAHELYIVIEETDLVEIIKKAMGKNLKLGKTIGVISYNDSPFKEILAGGISVLSTDFEKMGAEVAEMIQTCTRRKVRNPFSLILRGSV